MALFAGTLLGGTLLSSTATSSFKSTIISTQLLPLLWERLSSRESLSVLDLGIGTVQSLNFYSSRDSCVYFADIDQELASSDTTPSLTVDGFGGIDTFDVCFCWDFLNRMSSEELGEFASNLLPHCNTQTYIHVFVAHTNVVPLRMKKFAIRSRSELIWRNANSDEVIERPKTHGELLRFFPNLNYGGARLMDENRHELYGKIAV